MDDNARPHRARIVEEYLEDHGLERMEWPARSPDLNPIEHLWDYLGREVAALNPPPRSLHELKQGLLCVWSSLPYSGVRQLNKQHGKSMPPMHSKGSELANMVANDAKMVAKVAKLATNLFAKNDANFALPPRFRQVLIESPL
ncbi:DDE_3 domain-containing protein [Trichonephila clavipes]|nr:DDE_3 domain-containing protein [Trichonephila clavipes]